MRKRESQDFPADIFQPEELLLMFSKCRQTMALFQQNLFVYKCLTHYLNGWFWPLHKTNEK
jgi:hypothetical protein